MHAYTLIGANVLGVVEDGLLVTVHEQLSDPGLEWPMIVSASLPRMIWARLSR